MAYNNSGNYYRPSPIGGFSFFPPVIKALLIANVAVFLGMWFLGNFHIGDYYLGEFFYRYFALLPLGTGFMPWQLFTYMFIHAGFTHLLFNMLALWMFGMELENTMGSRRFLLFYILCGLGGGLANLLIAPLFTSVGPTVGASGAIYGVLLAFGMMFPDRLIFIYFFIPIKAKYFVILYMALEFISVGSMDGVAHFAHLGGALVGFIFLLADGYSFGTSFRRPRPAVFSSPFSRRSSSSSERYTNVSDAQVYDIREHQASSEETELQKRIDEILDKISKGGYQSLTDEEKRLLFEASKKLN
ncbi:MAG: rhomboid family intramembrane serine protease [Acidobacteriota bacterium]